MSVLNGVVREGVKLSLEGRGAKGGVTSDKAALSQACNTVTSRAGYFILFLRDRVYFPRTVVVECIHSEMSLGLIASCCCRRRRRTRRS